MKPALPEPLRRKLAFLASGTTGFVIYYCCSLALVRTTGLGAGAAAFVAVLLSIPPTFLLQRHFAFRSRAPLLPAFAKYCALQGVNAVLIGILARLGRQAGLGDALNFFASALVVVVVSYVVLGRFVFRGGGRP